MYIVNETSPLNFQVSEEQSGYVIDLSKRTLEPFFYKSKMIVIPQIPVNCSLYYDLGLGSWFLVLSFPQVFNTT